MAEDVVAELEIGELRGDAGDGGEALEEAFGLG